MPADDASSLPLLIRNGNNKALRMICSPDAQIDTLVTEGCVPAVLDLLSQLHHGTLDAVRDNDDDEEDTLQLVLKALFALSGNEDGGVQCVEGVPALMKVLDEAAAAAAAAAEGNEEVVALSCAVLSSVFPYLPSQANDVLIPMFDSIIRILSTTTIYDESTKRNAMVALYALVVAGCDVTTEDRQIQLFQALQQCASCPQTVAYGLHLTRELLSRKDGFQNLGIEGVGAGVDGCLNIVESVEERDVDLTAMAYHTIFDLLKVAINRGISLPHEKLEKKSMQILESQDISSLCVAAASVLALMGKFELIQNPWVVGNCLGSLLDQKTSASQTVTRILQGALFDISAIPKQVETIVKQYICKSLQYHTDPTVSVSLRSSHQNFEVYVARSELLAAGCGVFIRGRCSAGSLLAFYPGFVIEETHANKNNNSYLVQLQDGRYIDGHPERVMQRNIEQVVRPHPLCIGNLINHANFPMKPSAMFALVDVAHVQADSLEVLPVVPACNDTPPSVLTIVSTREIADEEILIDYHLIGDTLPSWYIESATR